MEQQLSGAGYSGTPLAKKLGIKQGSKLQLIYPPENYYDLFSEFPPNVSVTAESGIENDVIHLFVTNAGQYYEILPQLKAKIKKTGSVWVSWPKKASKVPTDVTEDIIRNYALQIGMVDIKVCAVDTTWSALKLVIPVKNR